MNKIYKKIAEELQIRESQVESTVKLIDEGNTIPFIARYRKEVTGNLSDEILRELDERLKYLRNLEERKEEIIRLIDEQGKLTDELTLKIASTMILSELEDIYRPFKPKKRTRATIAKEKGLEPLSTIIYEQNEKRDLFEIAKEYINDEKGVNSEEESIDGALDIIAENIADNADFRKRIKSFCFREAVISSKVAKEEKSPYEMYYDYSEPILKMPSHRILAINRGEKEEFLKVKLDKPEEKIIDYLKKQVIQDYKSQFAEHLEKAIIDSYKRLIEPSIEREIRSDLTEKAEDSAIKVFGKNLTQLLMQPPIVNQTVLGWDPAFRTGCKLAVVDATGKVLDTVVIYPTAPQNKVTEAKEILKRLIEQYQITLISVGNGTASRESEMVIVELLKELKKPVSYVIVNEAGASVYSASKLATEEFPNFDVGQRSAASIARRLQDPLAELVKIDPKSIGVGQYQHDMNQKKLGEALHAVVEDCVNHVGVDLNTASASLLEYVSGISKTIAKNIVAYREEQGKFTKRSQLLKVAKLGPKAYEQCAGFMRILNGENPFDATSVHPESYKTAEKLMEQLGYSKEDLKKGGLQGIGKKITDRKKLSAQLEIGEITLQDLVKELEKPARDPRDEMPKPILRTDVLEIKDLQPGMILKGTVRNVIDFGVFVDIGVHQDGLVHISQITDRFIKHPLEVVSVGDIVDVQVMSVDLGKKRIQLTMRIQQEK